MRVYSCVLLINHHHPSASFAAALTSNKAIPRHGRILGTGHRAQDTGHRDPTQDTKGHILVEKGINAFLKLAAEPNDPGSHFPSSFFFSH